MNGEQRYYELYHCKEKYKMELKPLRKIFDREKDRMLTDTLHYYNDCYYFSTNRKMLKNFATEMLEEWKEELNSIKI